MFAKQNAVFTKLKTNVAIDPKIGSPEIEISTEVYYEEAQKKTIYSTNMISLTDNPSLIFVPQQSFRNPPKRKHTYTIN